MIFYYFLDREMLNSFHGKIANGYEWRRVEKHIENELKCLIAFMPLDEQIIISPSFRYESAMCRSILERNRELLDENIIVNYMQETLERDFYEKKNERYKSVMDIEPDYKEAYNNMKTYGKVSAIPIGRVPKKQQVGENSLKIFSSSIRKKAQHKKIDGTVVEDILKWTEDTAEDAFLWERVLHTLNKRDVSPKIIRDLGIREEMNLSYLKVFQNQGVIIPYHGGQVNLNLPEKSIYNIWMICSILGFLGVRKSIENLCAKELLDLRRNADFQTAMEMIRKGLVNGESVYDIGVGVKGKYDLEKIIAMQSWKNNVMAQREKVCMKDNSLKLLHLSDLHLSDETTMNKFFFFLKLDLCNLIGITKLDYLIISGDVCERPQKEQYEVAVTFIKRIISEFNLDISKVIVVPGNHDCDREVSKKAYGSSGIEDEELYKERFAIYNEAFYEPLFSRKYSYNYECQIERCVDEDNEVYILGLNSSYLIDHDKMENSSICMDAIQNDEEVWKRNNYLKMVVWHHPLRGYAPIQDTTFMDSLVILGYTICFHGHIHEAVKDKYSYDDKSGMHIIGAGTFGAVSEDRGEGIPLQYNFVEIDKEERNIIVHTRKREKGNGAWMADARWGNKNCEPKAYYIIEY